MAAARPGVRLLDLATGTGTIASTAAARGASVVGVDASAGMLEVARTRSPNLDLRVADAAALPFGDGIFDVVTCGLSISHFEEREQALREVLRVLRRGGTFVASAWADGGSGPTRTAFQILDRYATPDDSLDEETWAEGAAGCEVLRAAGFTSVSFETELFSGTFADAEEALAWVVAWPLVAAKLERLDPRRREQFAAHAHEALAVTSLSWSFAFNFYVGQRRRRR